MDREIALRCQSAEPRAIQKSLSPTPIHHRRKSVDSGDYPSPSSASNLKNSAFTSSSRPIRGGIGKRKLVAYICLSVLIFTSVMFTVYNDSNLRGGYDSLRASQGALNRLRRSWIAQAIWLSDEDEDDDDPTASKAGNRTTEVPLVADPQRRVLEEQLFTYDQQEQRKKRVDDICDRYDLRASPLELDRDDLKQIIVDDDNRLLYCYIPKVACTNWKRIMMILTGSAGDRKKNPMDIQASDSHMRTGFKTLDQYSDEEIINRVRQYFKFMFVRHPFERLLSAYKNKFSERYSVYFQKKFGRKIIRRYRQEAKAESLVYGNDVTFREFVTYVLDPRTHVEGLNEHWRQYYKLCHPCHLNYDVIGKYETLYSDASLVLDRAGVSDRVTFPTYPPETRKKRAKTVDYIRDFFATIPTTELKDLKATYGLDFEFFGYKYPFMNDSESDDERGKKTTLKH